MGSILAMAAVVSVVAGIAVVATNKLHHIFGGGTPKDKKLSALVEEWRFGLREERATLTRLKTEELDLLGEELLQERKLLRAKHRQVGKIVTIYKEPVALYVSQTFPRAKVPTRLMLVQTKDNEFVFRQRGQDWMVSLDGAPPMLIEEGALIRADDQVLVERKPMRDERTIHVDRGVRTLAILHVKGISNQVAPRAYEFVDVREEGDRNLLEVLTFDYMLQHLE